MSTLLIVFRNDAEYGEYQLRQDGTPLFTSRCPFQVLTRAAVHARSMGVTMQLTDEAADKIVQLAKDSF